MSRDKPLWMGERHQNCNISEVPFLKTCICLIKLRYDTPKPHIWLQILSKWAVISHSDWGEASKLQHFRGALFEDLHLPNQAVIWQSKAPKCWLQILSKWAVISHADWGEASKLQHFNCSVLKTCMCFIKLWYDSPRPQNAVSRFSLNEPW